MLTPAAHQALEEAVSAASRCVACLLCFEQDHTNCHRCIVAEWMMQSRKFNLVHLNAAPLISRNEPSGRITCNDRTPAHIG
jgi:uncharacterized protein (DUF488 family)